MKVLFTLIFMLPFYPRLSSQTIKETIIHDERERMYLVHLPKHYDSIQSYPLIIALHGGNGKAKKFNKSTRYRFNELSDKENFIVVYPQGIDKSWNDNKNRNSYGEARTNNIDDVGFIEMMIQNLEMKYPVDSNNIFVCGISNGGLMSATLAVKLPNKIKAIGMVSSNFSDVFIKEIVPVKPTPFSMIIIQGTEDPIFPYSEGEITFFKQKRGRVIGAEKSISFINTLNGNSSEGVVTALPDIDPEDQCTSFNIAYPNTVNPNLKVELIKIVGGGHTWPGGYQYFSKKIIGNVTTDFNAVDELWCFFKSTIN